MEELIQELVLCNSIVKFNGGLGITDLSHVIKPKLYATQNFHGTYYLDSHILNDHLDFQRDSIDYFVDHYNEQFKSITPLSKFICKLPFGQKLMGSLIQNSINKLRLEDRGTMKYINDNNVEAINAYWGSKENWDKIPESLKDFPEFKDYDTVVHIDHGYDESLPPSELNLEMMRQASIFRGGQCISESMVQGDWKTPLQYQCAFGHTFTGSPRLILKGGHWCSECERKSWNYHERAEKDPFFAQVWNPIHTGVENKQEVIKTVSDLDI